MNLRICDYADLREYIIIDICYDQAKELISVGDEWYDYFHLEPVAVLDRQ